MPSFAREVRLGDREEMEAIHERVQVRGARPPRPLRCQDKRKERNEGRSTKSERGALFTQHDFCRWGCTS